jgi:tetratricopeptide (TPR) repeat protein
VWDRLSDILSLDPDGSLRFENNLVRDAAYEGLPYRRRRVLHERVGQTIEATAGESVEEEVATLALHFHEAQRWDKSWTYSRMAGDRAMKVYAIADAGRFYEQALTAGRHYRTVHATDLADVYLRWSEALRFLGRYRDSDRALGAARRLVGNDLVAAAPLVINQAILPSRQGRFRVTTARVTRALNALEGAQGPEADAIRARLLVINANTRFLQNRRVEAIEWARRAAGEADKAGAKDALAQAYKTLDMALKENGQADQAVYSAKALALYEELGDLRNQALVLNNLGLLAQERSSWDEALELYGRSLDIMDRTGDRANVSLAKYNIAEILSDQGRQGEAEALLREVIRVWRSQGADSDVADARRELGKVLAREGEFEAAREQLEQAHAEQIRAGTTGEALATSMRMGELAVLAGDWATATSHIRETLDLTERIEGGSVFVPALHRLHGAALVQAGAIDEGGEELRAALASARKRRDAYETALLLDLVIAIDEATGVDVSGARAELASLRERLGIVTMPAVSLGSIRPAEARPAE